MGGGQKRVDGKKKKQKKMYTEKQRKREREIMSVYIQETFY